MGYTAPYTSGGYTYNRKDALQVKGPYWSSANASSQSGSFSSNTTKYFYGYYTNDDGSSAKHPLALMNYSYQNSVSFGFMNMDAIQSGGTARTFTVTFNANGGSTPTASKTVTYNSTYGTLPTPTRSNYRFTGWYTSASGGTRIQASNKVTITANQTLYAHWVAVYYLDLNVYLNGSIINDTNVFHCDVTVGGTTQASNVCDYYKQHDTGSSWSVTGLTTASGYTRYSTGTTSGTLTAKTNCTIYIGRNYTITYDRNGGTSGNSTQTVNYGTSWTTKGATCVKPGYAQTSWNTAKDGSGTTYNLSTAQTSTQSANLTLYAIYTGNTYYVKYDANGGSGSIGNTTHRYGTPSNLSANTFTRTGYTFTGWNTQADGNGTALNDKHSLSGLTTTAGATVTIYAQWAINSYTLTVNPNGGTWNGSTSTQSFTQTYNTTKALPLPTRAGYFFIGWQDLGTGWTYDSNNDNICFENGIGNITTYCNANDGSVSITREAMSTPTGSGYGLKIHFNSSAQTAWGWGFVDSEQSEANTTFIHAFQAKVPKGYTLQYAYNACGDGATRRWLTSNEGTGDWATYAYETKCGSMGSFGTFGYVYLTGGSVPVTWYLASSNIYKSTGSTFYYSSGNGSLKAIWAPNRYTITYNANGGYSTPNTTSTSQIVTYDETFSFKNREYTKPGYVHIGWNTKADGSGTKYTFGASTTYTIAGNLTLYAQWRAATANEQKIYLYNNGYCEALGFAKTSDWYGFKKGVVGAKDFTIGTPASSKSKTMQFKGMIVKNLT